MSSGGVPRVTELRVVRARIAELGRALQDPIDQQILWHLLSAERGGSHWVHQLVARTRPGAHGNDDDTSTCPLITSRPLEGCEVTPSLTAHVTRRPKPEIRVHYRHLHEQGLIERGRRIARLGWLEHTYALAPRLRPILEAVSAFALPDPPEEGPMRQDEPR